MPGDTSAGNFLSQHDSAPAYKASRLQDFVEDEVEQLPCPPNSPDRNPNEHAWECLRPCHSAERGPATHSG